MSEKVRIEPNDVGSLQDVLGPNDPLLQPAPPSREAEIAALLDGVSPSFDPYVVACRYLLAQLQQARQERDTAYAKAVAEFPTLGEYEKLKAALQQAREALKEAEAQKTVAQKRLTKYLQDEGR